MVGNGGLNDGEAFLKEDYVPLKGDYGGRIA